MNLDVGKIIKTCRTKAKMSQEDLADLLHTTQATVSRIEKNVVSCEVNTFMRIVQATNTQDLAIAMLFDTTYCILFGRGSNFVRHRVVLRILCSSRNDFNCCSSSYQLGGVTCSRFIGSVYRFNNV